MFDCIKHRPAIVTNCTCWELCPHDCPPWSCGLKTPWTWAGGGCLHDWNDKPWNIPWFVCSWFELLLLSRLLEVGVLGWSNCSWFNESCIRWLLCLNLSFRCLIDCLNKRNYQYYERDTKNMREKWRHFMLFLCII